MYVGHTYSEADTAENTTINVPYTAPAFYFKVIWEATGPENQTYQVKIMEASNVIEEIETQDTQWISSTDKLTDIYSTIKCSSAQR